MKNITKKSLANREKSGKIFMKIGELLCYNRCNPKKKKAFMPYSETEKSLGSNLFNLFFRGKGGKMAKEHFAKK